MERFNNKIEPGQPAMIIKTRQPENSYLIGRIVVVEALTQTGGTIPEQYVDKSQYETVNCKVEGAIAASTGFKMNGIAEGYMHIAQVHLMPLPPLPEEELAKDKELELS